MMPSGTKNWPPLEFFRDVDGEIVGVVTLEPAAVAVAVVVDVGAAVDAAGGECLELGRLWKKD